MFVLCSHVVYAIISEDVEVHGHVGMFTSSARLGQENSNTGGPLVDDSSSTVRFGKVLYSQSKTNLAF